MGTARRVRSSIYWLRRRRKTGTDSDCGQRPFFPRVPANPRRRGSRRFPMSGSPGSCWWGAGVPGESGAEAADPRVIRMTEPRRGYGRACRAGLARLARSSGGPPEVVVFLGGDGQDDPRDIPRLLDALERSPVDLVVGSRVRGKAPGSPLHPRWSNRLATGILRLRHRYRFTDIGPLRAICWETLQQLDPRDPDFGWPAEMQAAAARAGIPAAEVPVRGARRTRSGNGRTTGVVAGIKILLTCLLPAGSASPPREPGPPPAPVARPDAPNQDHRHPRARHLHPGAGAGAGGRGNGRGPSELRPREVHGPRGAGGPWCGRRRRNAAAPSRRSPILQGRRCAPARCRPGEPNSRRMPAS